MTPRLINVSIRSSSTRINSRSDSDSCFWNLSLISPPLVGLSAINSSPCLAAVEADLRHDILYLLAVYYSNQVMEPYMQQYFPRAVPAFAPLRASHRKAAPDRAR